MVLEIRLDPKQGGIPYMLGGHILVPGSHLPTVFPPNHLISPGKEGQHDQWVQMFCNYTLSARGTGLTMVKMVTDVGLYLIQSSKKIKKNHASPTPN